jgi:hypothetical protein
MSLAVEHGFVVIEEAMEIARKTAAGLAHTTAAPDVAATRVLLEGE